MAPRCRRRPASWPFIHGQPYLQVCRRVPLGEPIAAETFTAPQEFEETDFYRAHSLPPAPSTQRHRDACCGTDTLRIEYLRKLCVRAHIYAVLRGGFAG